MWSLCILAAVKLFTMQNHLKNECKWNPKSPSALRMNRTVRGAAVYHKTIIIYHGPSGQIPDAEFPAVTCPFWYQRRDSIYWGLAKDWDEQWAFKYTKQILPLLAEPAWANSKGKMTQEIANTNNLHFLVIQLTVYILNSSLISSGQNRFPLSVSLFITVYNSFLPS